MKSFTCRLVIFVVTLLACATSAAAQVSPLINIRLGYGRQYPLQKFFPAVVEVAWLGNADLTGSKNNNNDAAATFNARLYLSYAQDDTYTLTVERPLTLREGTPSVHPIYIRTARAIDEMRVLLVHEDGRELGFWRINPTASTAGTIPGAQFGGATVVEVGQRSLQTSEWIWGGNSILVGFSELDTAAIEYATLPTSWVGYDSVDVLILNDPGTAALSGPQLACLRDWVLHGGNLVIVAAADRRAYDMVFPQNELGLTLDEYGPTQTGSDFTANLLKTAGAVSQVDTEVIENRANINRVTFVNAMTQEQERIQQTLQDLDDQQTYHRQIAMSPMLEELGWRAHWVTDDLVDPTPNADGIGNMLTGPFGLGHITILGINPVAAVRSANPLSVAVAWWHVTQHLDPMRELIAQWQSEVASVNNYWSGYMTAADREQVILNRHLDTVSEGFETSTGLFNLIALVLLGLIVILGPIDFLVFRRLQRLPLTWLSCIGWIIIASLIIFKGQTVVTSGVLDMRRVMTIDVTGDDAAIPCRYRAISSLRSNRTANYGLEGLKAQQYLLPVSHREMSYWRESTIPWIRASVRQQDDRSHDLTIRVPMENVRWIEDCGFTERPDISATLTRDGLDLMLDLDLPEGATATGAVINWRGRIYEDPAGGPFGIGRARLTRSTRVYNPRTAFANASDAPWLTDEASSVFTYFRSAHHRGLSRFEDNLANRPDKAILVVTLENMPSAVSLRDHPEVLVQQTVHVRMLLDVDAENGEPAP